MVPIKLPNDGPLSSILSSPKEFNHTQEEGRNSGDGIQEALTLLQTCQDSALDHTVSAVDQKQNAEHNDHRYTALYAATKKALIGVLTAESIRAQLSSLRAYRSTLLHIQKKSQDDENEQQQKHSDNDEIQQNNLKTSIAMYRILLEWSLSFETPHALKKASHACLPVLKYFSQKPGTSEEVESTEVYNDVHKSIMNSFFDQFSTDSAKSTSGDDNITTIWKHPVHTLFEFQSFPPTLDLLLHAKDDRDCEEYSIKAFKFILAEGKKVESLIQNYYYEDTGTSDSITNQSSSDTGMKDADADSDMVGVVGVQVLDAVNMGIELCTTLKGLLLALLPTFENRNLTSTTLSEVLSQILERLIVPLLRCRATSASALCICGVALGQLMLCQYRINDDNTTSNDEDLRIAREVAYILDLVTKKKGKAVVDSPMIFTEVAKRNFVHTTLPELTIVAILRGIAGSMTDNILVKSVAPNHSDNNAEELHSLLIYSISSYILKVSQTSTDNAVRLSALKGLDTTLGKCKSILSSTKTHEDASTDYFQVETKILLEEVLQVSLVTWESPPCRQVGSAVPSLFYTLIDTMEALDKNQPEAKENETSGSSIDVLVRRVMAQPLNRKGRYVALEALLPKVGASKLIAIGDLNRNEQGQSRPLILSFIDGIGNRGNNAGAIAELLAKVLSMLREEMLHATGVDVTQQPRSQENKKARRKRERALQKQLKEGKGTDSYSEKDDVSEEKVEILPEWIQSWCPYLVSSLLSPEATRRSSIASFCLPLITKICGGPSQRLDASHAFAALLDEVDKQGMEKGKLNDVDNVNTLAKDDYILWSKLMIVRHAYLQKLIKNVSTSTILRDSIRKSLPSSLMKTALKHEMPFISLVAFQAMDAVLLTYELDTAHVSIRCIEMEVNLWEECLPYAFKCSEKEYVSKVMDCLSNLLHRISIVQADEEDDNLVMQLGGSSTSNLLTTFVVKFLLKDLFVNQAAYPGTVSEKEKFALSMIDCLLSFSSLNEKNRKGKTSATVGSKNAMQTKRKLNPVQKVWCKEILEALNGDNVFLTLMSMMHSMWDSTRMFAFELICDIIDNAMSNGITLPSVLCSCDSRKTIQARAIHLASSPRQREADTGARILVILCQSLPTLDQKLKYVDEFCDILRVRVILMERALGAVLGLDPKTDNDNELHADTKQSEYGDSVPLAHGLIQSLRLMTEKMRLCFTTEHLQLLERIVACCWKAIEVSLAVVADTKQTGSESNNNNGNRKRDGSKSTPLNVNTGAIGANATFASLKATDKDEEKSRLATQRVIMGSWLLTKEACAALSSILELFPNTPSFPLMSSSGDLLIRTLTSLKHQGAAFAAHKSLQRLCGLCYSEDSKSGEDKVRSLPSIWAKRLLHEISSIEIVRDSTLRRSTGYGLGFLSTLRSECDNVSPRFLFPFVLANILKLSLPSFTPITEQAASWDFSSSSEMFSYTSILKGSSENYHVLDSDYEWRCRVHALNVLRLVILDAPLAVDMRQFVGDAIISGLIGYKDSSWGVRNSATMTIAAAMLRVIDADKNADNINSKSKTDRAQTNGNAVTARELFRSYPSLATCLLQMVKEETSNLKLSKSLHPSLFPILLLLSRLQPASNSTVDADANNSFFIDPIMKCLGHVHKKVRVMASRALAVLCTGDDDNKSSRPTIINKCLEFLSFRQEDSSGIDHNLDHGVLLAIKAILATSNNPNKLFDGALCQAVVHFATWSNWKRASPPSCVAVALEIWAIACDTHPEKSSANLPNTVNRIVHDIESLTKFAGSGCLVGLADLAITSANISAESSFEIIFNVNTEDTSQLTRHLQQAQCLFLSPSYDIQLHSVKTFKKNICQAVDAVVGSRTNNKEYRATLLHSVSKMLVEAIFALLTNSSTEIHPPTLRRLSRCAIECMYAYLSLDKAKTNVLFELNGYDTSSTWKHLEFLRHIGGGGNEYGKGGNSLSGNALELMALFLAEQLSSSDNGAFKFIASFEEYVHFSTDQFCHWKVRYSAAVAIRESGLLSVTGTNNEHDNSLMESSQLKVQLLLLKLLQDGDSDVRHAAGTAIASSVKYPTVSLLTMDTCFRSIVESCSKSTPFTLFINQLVQECEGVEEQIALSKKEFSFSFDAPPADKLLNLSMDRKIFEEEDPNPFKEEFVLIHMMAAMVMASKFKDNQIDRKTAFICNEIVTRCKSILNDLLSSGISTIGHDITWDILILPKLHGLILGTILTLYFGGEQTSEEKECANEVVEMAKTLMGTENLMIHPSIVDSLETLSAVTSLSDEEIYERIARCCFLLPRATCDGSVD